MKTSFSALQGKPIILKLLPAVGIVVFAVWGLGPLMRQSRNIFLHVCVFFSSPSHFFFPFFFPFLLTLYSHFFLQKSDGSWGKSSTNFVMTSYLQPLLLWTGAMLICRFKTYNKLGDDFEILDSNFKLITSNFLSVHWIQLFFHQKLAKLL